MLADVATNIFAARMMMLNTEKWLRLFSLQMAAARTRKLGGKNNAAAVRIADVAVQSLYLPWEVISRIETRALSRSRDE